MSTAILLRQETNLVGKIKNFPVLANSMVIYAEFFDLKTGLSRAPDPSTKYFTLNKDNLKFEAVLASSVSTDVNNLTTITVATNGRSMPLQGTGLGTALGNTHSIGDEIGCVYTHQQLEEVLEVLSGTNGTGGASFKVGRDIDENITIFANNNDLDLPFIRYDFTLNKWIISNDGINSYDPAAGGSGVTAGNGIEILAGVVSAKIKPGGGLAFDGDELVAAGFQSVIDHEKYDPAFVTSGAGVLNDPATWALVTNGSFRVTIDGVARNIDGISFTGVASQADVATRIQNQIRAVTSSTETCVWDAGTSRFIISSAKTDGTGTITVLSTSTGTVGTDISGLGGVNFLDMDSGNGTVTNTVLNPALDAGSIVGLDTNGNINNNLLNGATTSAGVADAAKVVITNASGLIDNSFILAVPKTVRLFHNSTASGSSTTRFDITKTGDTVRYTYDGTGTNPGIDSTTCPIDTYVRITGTNFNSNNTGWFRVTNSGTNFFEVTNASGVAENDKTIGSGQLLLQSGTFRLLGIVTGSTTQFDITNPSGSTFRYTYDGTGTDPLINADRIKVGDVIDIQGTNFNVGNQGTFVITNVGANFFEVTNASGVAELNVAMNLGNMYIGLVYTPITSTKWINIEAQGAGETALTVPDTSGINGALGGSSGGYSRSYALSPITYNCIVGTYNAQASSANQPISGRTIFGSIICNGGTTRTATGGQINIDGGLSSMRDTNSGDSYGSNGADSMLGRGGRAGEYGQSGNPATGYGAGGGGGTEISSARTGGLGTPGIILITEYFI